MMTASAPDYAAIYQSYGLNEFAALRLAFPLSRAELSAQSGLDLAQIAEIERGARPASEEERRVLLAVLQPGGTMVRSA